MKVQSVEGVKIEGVCACLPAASADVAAADIVRATGIRTRRIAAKGTTPLDLCLAAARRVLDETQSALADFGAVLFVSFTHPDRMPAGAAQAQGRLGLPQDVIALDVSLACSGWGYGLYLAGLLVRETGKKVLLLDGDVQSACVDPKDASTASILADAGTATVVGAGDGTWKFAFLSDGEKGAALKLPQGGTIAMDGFGVFKFVATDVVRFLKEFQAAAAADAVDAFVPHQANVYMIRQLAKSLGVADEKLWISCDELGNSASASVPVTLAFVGRREAKDRRVLFAGFGGGLSACAGEIAVSADCKLSVIDG